MGPPGLASPVHCSICSCCTFDHTMALHIASSLLWHLLISDQGCSSYLWWAWVVFLTSGISLVGLLTIFMIIEVVLVQILPQNVHLFICVSSAASVASSGSLSMLMRVGASRVSLVGTSVFLIESFILVFSVDSALWATPAIALNTLRPCGMTKNSYCDVHIAIPNSRWHIICSCLANESMQLTMLGMMGYLIFCFHFMICLMLRFNILICQSGICMDQGRCWCLHIFLVIWCWWVIVDFGIWSELQSGIFGKIKSWACHNCLWQVVWTNSSLWWKHTKPQNAEGHELRDDACWEIIEWQGASNCQKTLLNSSYAPFDF